MSDLHGWLLSFPGVRRVPMFDTDDTLVVRTHQRGQALDRRILTRAPAFDAAMIKLRLFLGFRELGSEAGRAVG